MFRHERDDQSLDRCRSGNDDRGEFRSKRLEVTAVNGLFNVDKGLLETEKSKFNATGRFDSQRDSELDVSLVSTDATRWTVYFGS